MTKRKILLELEYEEKESFEDNHMVVFSHPDLKGTLFFKVSSKKLVDLQLKDLDYNQEKHLDPINSLINSANKLIEGVTELKETVMKK